LRDLIFDALLCGPESGAVVVLLHGWPECSSWWRDSLEALGAAGYRALAFDQRGYSRGTRPLEVAEYCPDRLVHDVLGWPTPSARSLSIFSTPHPIALQESRKADPKQDRRLDYVRFF